MQYNFEIGNCSNSGSALEILYGYLSFSFLWSRYSAKKITKFEATSKFDNRFIPHNGDCSLTVVCTVSIIIFTGNCLHIWGKWTKCLRLSRNKTSCRCFSIRELICRGLLAVFTRTLGARSIYAFIPNNMVYCL